MRETRSSMVTAAPEYAVRKYVYDHFLRTGTAPSIAIAAREIGRTEEAAREAFAAIASSGAFTLQRETGEIWRAAPFCAVPTAFAVESGGRKLWGTCAWDALGIPAMLHEQAMITTSCACCNHPMTLSAGPRGLWRVGGVIHIAVPARHWYDDVAFT